MSVSSVAVAATLLATISHPQVGVTAGPYKAGAVPGATVAQRVANHGTIPETIAIGVDEIGRTTSGVCGFTHRAPLAVPSISSVYLRPGEARDLTVTLARTAPAGYHAVTVDYTVTGAGNVKVVEGVATVIGVTYPGSAPSSAPCVAISAPASQTPAPTLPAGIAAGVLALILAAGGTLVLRRRRRAA